MTRLTRDQMFMQIAEVVARRATCARLNVGAVMVSNKRIVSIGYNGAPSTEPHCDERPCGRVPGMCETVHAEKNAILYCPVKPSTCTLYITHSPCADCVEVILNVGIKRVVFGTAYRNTGPLSVLRDAGVTVQQCLPNGYLLDWVP